MLIPDNKILDSIHNLATRCQCNINALRAARNDCNPKEMRRRLLFLENFLGEVIMELDTIFEHLTNQSKRKNHI